MSYFAAVLTRAGSAWVATEVYLDECESVDDIAETVRDVPGDTRLLVVEQDDEYAVLGRFDEDEEPRVFLSDGRAADAYPLAAAVADDLDEIGEQDPDLVAEDLPPIHESVPFGDPSVVEDLGTDAADLLALCAAPSTLPIDVIMAVCEKAGATDAFEAVRA